MDAAAARLTERLSDHGASAMFGGAIAFALYSALGQVAAQPALGASAAAAGASAYWLIMHLLGGIAPAVSAAPLIGDLPSKVMDAPERDSTVVRLFDPAALPASRPVPASPGDPANRPSLPAPPDASQALHDALSELRRSLR